MSTKTTFKRIALVAVAALGLGVLSVAPSSAAASGVAITGVTNASVSLRSGSTTTVNSDTTTAATFAVSGLFTDLSDTATVQVFEKSRPAAASTAATVRLAVADTSTAVTSVTSGGTAVKNWYRSNWGNADTNTAGGSFKVNASTAGNVGATFGLYLDTLTAAAAGAYVYSISVTTSSTNGAGSISVTTQTADITITVAAGTADSKTISPALSTAFIGSGTGSITSDAAVSAVSTVTGSAVANVTLALNNASGTTGVVEESVTATVTGAGVISFDNSSYGKSITANVTAGAGKIYIRGDGTAGTTSIAISSTNGFTATKTMTFYAKAAKTITAAVAQPVLATGANAGAVSVTAVDASGSNWTGTAYIVASSAADELVAGSATTPVACAAWNADDGILCPVTALTAGTAKFKVIDASTVALATATSNEVTVTVSAATPASVKLAFDKSSYAPFEKALITVTVLDKDGKTLQGANRDNILATGGITSTYAFGTGSDTLTATTINTSKTTGTSTTAGAKTYVVYIPAAGDVKITATGGTALPLAGQVAVPATASVVNSSVDAATDAANEATDAANAATDAALAAADAADAATAAAQDASDAVAALSATVAKLVASLKAQITSLTNLVIKIQKKVRA